MAKIRWTPGNEGPVNEGERRVLKLLQDGLPDNFEIFPNFEFSIGHGQLAECDALILGPDCVWLIETKDIFGRVEIQEQSFTVNDESRAHPAKQSRRKAQKIKNRVASDPMLRGIWIQNLVVFARKPQQLRVSAKMKDFISLAERGSEVAYVLDLLLDPSLIGLNRNRLSLDQRDRFKAQLDLHIRTRRSRPAYGNYLCTEVLRDDSDFQWWNAEHRLLGYQVLLEIIRIDPTLPPDRRQQIQTAAVKEARVKAAVGASVFLVLPEDAFIADDGSIVVVHLSVPSGTLGELGDDIQQWDDTEKRRLVWCIASAVERLHSRGVTHRRIGPDSIYVSSNGSAKLGGLSTAGFKGGPNRTFGTSDWGGQGGEFFASPEHSNGHVTAKSDIYALGVLIDFLWPDGIPVDLRISFEVATADDPNDRTITAREIATRCQTPPPIILQQLSEGLVLENRFKLVERRGRGATSEVWQAEDLQGGGHVALKFFLNADAGSSAQHEYQALKDVNHPGILRVIDFRQLAGWWVLISRSLEGPSLRLAMPPVAPKLSNEQAVAATVEILNALRAIHPDMERIIQLIELGNRTEQQEQELADLRASGIAHRDIKPENIILVDGYRPVLVDFGLASTGLTGEEGGTLEYRPPGVALDSADPDVDLFAVGIILHQMLTGKHPYQDADPTSGELIIDDSLDRNVQRVIRKACAVRFADRFRSADEFIEALLALRLKAIPLPEPPLDVTARFQEIMDLAIAEDWDKALKLCPESWSSIRAQILQRRELAEAIAKSTPLLAHDAFELHYVKSESFETATALDGATVGPGSVRIYTVTGSSGELIDFGYFLSNCGTGWLRGLNAYLTPSPLKKLGDGGLRLGIYSRENGMFAELAEARINSDDGNSNLYKASQEKLDSDVGLNCQDVFTNHGASGFGTRESIIGDVGPRKTYLCATFPKEAEDLPAVLFFVTRFLPLARGIRQ